MKEQHLTEEQLQLYAAGAGEHADATAHLSGCEHCRQQVAVYQLLFTELKDAPLPAFDFDVAALIIPQLPVAAPQPATTHYNNYLVPGIAIAALLIPAVVFRAYFINLIKTMPVVFIYPMLLIPLLFILFRGIQLYREYQRKIEALNIYEPIAT